MNASLPGTLIIIFLLAGCATNQPRITEVSHQVVTHSLGARDERLASTDKSQHLSLRATPLPKEQQHEVFYVAWRSTTVATVRLQYRQINTSTIPREQTFTPHQRNSTSFRVAGEEFRDGGPVSAWRVTLLGTDGETLAELKSATW